MKSRKYTDQDIYKTMALIGVAEEYLLNYSGGFRFLTSCREYMIRNGAITISMARGVLNCMLMDPNVDYLPAPRDLTDATTITIPKPLKPRPRLTRVYVKVRWKYRYVLSTHKVARVAHILHPASRLAFYPATNSYSWELRVWCGVNLRERYAEMHEDANGRKVCARCTDNEREGVNLYGSVSRAR